MYYRDPELFLKQSVVDRYVDDIAFNIGVKREALHVVRSSNCFLICYQRCFLRLLS
jgi:meiotic recombination protein SPO11